MRSRTAKKALVFRPSIPTDLEQAARLAGAPMGLTPRDYIVLALRDALRKAGKLPEGWGMSPGERIAVKGGGA